MNPEELKKRLEAIEVIGLGQACIDYLGQIPAYPLEDQKVELMGLYERCGGPASTALVTLSRLGIFSSFIGSISDDAFGVEIEKALKKENVDVTFLKLFPGYTSQFAFIAISKQGGKRTIFWHRGSVPHLKKTDVDMERFPNAQILHLDGLMIEASIEAASQAKEKGLTVVMDAGTMREGTEKLVPMVDVIIASETFADPLVSKDAAHEKKIHAIKGMGPKQVIITLGAEGSIGLYKEEIVRQPSFPIEAVDTTGAGDVYHGAYIFGLLKNWEMPRCMLFASAAAALKCRTIGARTAIPDLEMVNAFIEHHSKS